MKLGTIAFLTGFIGDLALQLIVKNSKEENKWGLKTYFDQHGVLESATIAGGMLYGFTKLYKEAFDKSFTNTEGLVLYGASLDLIFRYGKLFPSLKDYYKKQSIPLTVLWGIIPFLIVESASNFTK